MVGDQGPEPEETTRAAERAAARARMDQQATWVELQLREAVRRGEFEGLPGYGKPIEDLGPAHDPDWWVKKLVEREQISGVLPPALQLRKDDAELDARLDRLSLESEVRREVEDFNERVAAAFYQPLGGPPLVTRARDVETEVERWRERRRTTSHSGPVDGQVSPGTRRNRHRNPLRLLRRLRHRD